VGRYPNNRARIHSQAPSTEFAFAQVRLHFEPFGIHFGDPRFNKHRQVLLRHYFGNPPLSDKALEDLDKEIQDFGGYKRDPTKRKEAAALAKANAEETTRVQLERCNYLRPLLVKCKYLHLHTLQVFTEALPLPDVLADFESRAQIQIGHCRKQVENLLKHLRAKFPESVPPTPKGWDHDLASAIEFVDTVHNLKTKLSASTTPAAAAAAEEETIEAEGTSPPVPPAASEPKKKGSYSSRNKELTLDDDPIAESSGSGTPAAAVPAAEPMDVDSSEYLIDYTEDGSPKKIPVDSITKPTAEVPAATPAATTKGSAKAAAAASTKKK